MLEKMSENYYGKINSKPSMIFELESLAITKYPSIASNSWIVSSKTPYYEETYRVTEGSLEMLIQTKNEQLNASLSNGTKTY